jgi:hypothetical protein
MSILSKKTAGAIESSDNSKVVVKNGGEYWFYNAAGFVTYVIANRSPTIYDDISLGFSVASFFPKWFDTSQSVHAVFYCNDSTVNNAAWTQYADADYVYNEYFNLYSNVGNLTNAGQITVNAGGLVFGSEHTAASNYHTLTITPSTNSKSYYYHIGSGTAVVDIDLDTNGFSTSVGSVFYLTCDNAAGISLLTWSTTAGIFAGSDPAGLSSGQTVEVTVIASSTLVFRVY